LNILNLVYNLGYDLLKVTRGSIENGKTIRHNVTLESHLESLFHEDRCVLLNYFPPASSALILFLMSASTLENVLGKRGALPLNDFPHDMLFRLNFEVHLDFIHSSPEY
jgi:hypothetical protein